MARRNCLLGVALRSVLMGLAGVVTGCAGTTEPRPESTGQVYSETIIQRGVSRSIHGESTPLLFPDELFELDWRTDGPGGLLAVSVWETRIATLGPTAILSFAAPSGCGTRNGVTISSLPAGHAWELRLGYPAEGRNPCSPTQPVVSRAEWLLDFSTLPISPTPPGSIIITRVVPA